MNNSALSNPPPTKETELFVYGASGHGKVVADIALVFLLLPVTWIHDDSPSSTGKNASGVSGAWRLAWLAMRANSSRLRAACCGR